MLIALIQVVNNKVYAAGSQWRYYPLVGSSAALIGRQAAFTKKTAFLPVINSGLCTDSRLDVKLRICSKPE